MPEGFDAGGRGRCNPPYFIDKRGLKLGLRRDLCCRGTLSVPRVSPRDDATHSAAQHALASDVAVVVRRTALAGWCERWQVPHMSWSPRELLLPVLMLIMHGCRSQGDTATAAVSAAPPSPPAATTVVATTGSSRELANQARYSELGFFSSLSGTLEIELSEPARPVSDKLANLAAPPGAKIKSLRLVLGVLDGDVQRKLTDAELDSVALRESHVVLRGESGKELEYDAPNGEYFTVRDLIHAIEQTESVVRAESKWLGGVDVHHVYFEGLEMNEPGHFEIQWGS